MMSEHEARNSVVEIFRATGHNRETAINLLTLKVVQAYHAGAIEAIDRLIAPKRFRWRNWWTRKAVARG